MTQTQMITPKRNEDIKTTVLPDGYAVLVSEKTNWAHTLTPLAALVWEFCDGRHSLDQIVSNLESIPEMPGRNSLRQEVTDLLEQFDEDGFILTD